MFSADEIFDTRKQLLFLDMINFCLPKAMLVFRGRLSDQDFGGTLWKLAVLLLNAAQERIHPANGHNDLYWPHGSNTANLAGTQFCSGKVRFVIWTITADLDFIGPEFGFAAPRLQQTMLAMQG